MRPETVTLIVGLAGIAGTLISSGLGLYFTAKARTSVLRESLFAMQLELARKIVYRMARIRIYFTILTERNGPFEEQARDDIGESIREFSELQEEGAAILPVELWVEVKRLNDLITGVLTSYDEGNGVSAANIKDIISHSTKVGLLSRSALGIDELTTESIKLYSSEESIQRVADLEIEHFKKIYDEANA